MAYEFRNQQKASAQITPYLRSSFKLNGINGEQTSAENFYTAIDGLLFCVGKNEDAEFARNITQSVYESND